MDDLDQLEKAHTDAAWSNFEERGDLSKDIAALLDAVPGLIAELRTLRARVAELEEDRQAERDRILGVRVREIARQHDARLDPYGFARAVMRAMEEER